MYEILIFIIQLIENKKNSGLGCLFNLTREHIKNLLIELTETIFEPI